MKPTNVPKKASTAIKSNVKLDARKECLEALYFIAIATNYSDGVKRELKIIQKLIDEHFELLDKYDKLERENRGLKTTIKNLREKEDKRYKAITGGKYE